MLPCDVVKSLFSTEMARADRHLAALISADAVGYSRFMASDESNALEAFSERSRKFSELVARHGGRLVQAVGDNLLAEFSSATEAVQCGVEFQRSLRDLNAVADRPMEFRLGIHVGDVIVREGQLHGGAVNIAARLEGLCDPGGVLISRETHAQVQGKLAYAYESRGQQQLKNIPEPVEVFQVRWDSDARFRRRWFTRRSHTAIRAALMLAATGLAVAVYLFHPLDEVTTPANPPLPKIPSVAVLPLVNFGGDPEQDYFAEGLTDHLITRLSKVSGLFVIARDSSFAYQGQHVDSRRVGRELGVRYLVEGSVQKSSERVRVNAQLIDAATGGHVWSDVLERPVAELFVLQDSLVDELLAGISVHLTDPERAEMTSRETNNLEAYDHFLRWVEDFYQLDHPAAFRDGIAHLEAAVEIDPQFGFAWGALAYTHALVWEESWPTVAASAEAWDRMQEALEEAPEHPVSLGVRSRVAMFDDPPEAVRLAEKAVHAMPNYPWLHLGLAMAQGQSGRRAEAIESFQRAARLNPRPSPRFALDAGRAAFALGLYEEAIDYGRLVARDLPNVGSGQELQAVGAALLGRLHEAQRARDQVLAIWPFTNIWLIRENMGILPPNDFVDRWVEGMRIAGFPETPFGLEPPSEHGLDGAEIGELLFGRKWTGASSQGHAYERQVRVDGTYEIRTTNGLRLEGSLLVKGDKLCRLDALYYGQSLCGRVYRRPGIPQVGDREYFWFTPVGYHAFDTALLGD